jgi:AcrR family transcriptional regulator
MPEPVGSGRVPTGAVDARTVVWQARAMTLGSAAGGGEPSERRNRSRTARRDALVHRALSTLGELGESATMEDLAAGMGVNKAALYRLIRQPRRAHRALIGRWVSRALSDFRAVVFACPPAAEMIERGFLAYLDVLERERSTYLALAQLGHVAGPRGEEHLSAYIAAAGDVVTEVMYARLPGVPAGGELGRTWGQALAGMSHHVADRWARTPWAPKEDVARSLSRLVLPALEGSLHHRSTPP